MIEESRNIGVHSYDDNYRRFGIASLPWSAVSPASGQRVTAAKVKLLDIPGNRAYAQVDAIDPDDRSLDELTIYIAELIPGGGVDEGTQVCRLQLDYTIDDVTYTPDDIEDHRKKRRASEEITKSYFLHFPEQGHIGAYVYLPAEPYGWQGGAITSVQLDWGEILDAPAAEKAAAEGHDAEKRLQLDRVSIANPPWAARPSVEKLLYKEPWTFVAAGSGPVRAWVNIRSPKFGFDYEGEDGNKTKYDCYAYRVISAFRNADYLIEDLYVKGVRPNGKAPVRLNFAAHYFLKMCFGDARCIGQVPLIPDWFSIATNEAPRPGFGFASTVPTVRIDHPPSDYPNRAGEKSAFGWHLGYGYSVRCLHLFRRWRYPQEMMDDTGRTWFELIYKPLKARLI